MGKIHGIYLQQQIVAVYRIHIVAEQILERREAHSVAPRVQGLTVARRWKKKSYSQDSKHRTSFRVRQNREHHPLPTTHLQASKHQITSNNSTAGRKARVYIERKTHPLRLSLTGREKAEYETRILRGKSSSNITPTLSTKKYYRN